MRCKIKPPKPLSLLQLNVKRALFSYSLPLPVFPAHPSNRFKSLLVFLSLSTSWGFGLIVVSKKYMGGILPLEPNDGVNDPYW